MFTPEVWQAILLGIVQGIAEFLPISSSGHLVVFAPITGDLLGTTTESHESLILNVVLHVGTLLSIVVVYRKALWELLKQFQLCFYIVLATIPVGIVGLTLKPLLDQAFETPLVVAIGWLATAVMLLSGQKWATSSENCRMEEMGPGRALMIGMFQAVALVPGISRSGSTIAGGMLSGLRREDAATFSFFIAIPAISAAALKVGLDAMNLNAESITTAGSSSISWTALLAGAATSFVVGIVCLQLLIKAVKMMKLHWFAYYCVAMAIGTIIWQLSVARSVGSGL